MLIDLIIIYCTICWLFILIMDYSNLYFTTSVIGVVFAPILLPIAIILSIKER